MEEAIQNDGNVPVWLEFPRKGWDQSNIGAPHSEPTERVNLPFGKAKMNDQEWNLETRAARFARSIWESGATDEKRIEEL